MSNENPGIALVLIDLQKNMLDPGHPVVGAEALTARLQGLLGRARAATGGSDMATREVRRHATDELDAR